ncbi:MAG TPA: hypothetical protein VM008_00260 [Phycisphaerae bacterium]|nr:hypothetical protein [Phycisphaerae bacterium]
MPKFIVESLADNVITLRVPPTNYRNAFVLKPGSSISVVPGERIRGTIHAPAWKVDRVDLGGNYVEPLYGRPRRMQGTILSVNPATNELTVQVGYEVTVKLPEKYKAADFQPGQRVGWDNIEIPAFEPAPVTAPTA